jgi:hypothetical protein
LNIWPIWMCCCSWLVSSLFWKWSIVSSFFQANDTFICNFVSLVKICPTQLYSMFVNLVTKFQVEMFHEHHGLLNCVHKSITLEWIPMLEFSLEHLIFNVNETQIYFKYIHKIIRKNICDKRKLR